MSFREAVRLGQHHLRKNTTCIKDSVTVECANLIEIPVEESLVLGDSNFVLYKLQRSIVYDGKLDFPFLFFNSNIQNFTVVDYIRPICLPLNDTTRPTINELLTTSGWKDVSGKYIIYLIKW